MYNGEQKKEWDAFNITGGSVAKSSEDQFNNTRQFMSQTEMPKNYNSSDIEAFASISRDGGV